jgi:NitT/TauT family transport system substrate-binding protein
MLLVALALAGCVPMQPEDTKLKVALIPVLDVLPVFVAQQNGYFAEQGIEVEAIPVKSAQERDVLLQTGQTDGVLTDLQSTALLNKDGAKVKAVYTSRRPYPDAPMFRILAGPATDLSVPADLKGVPIGISQNTVIEYLTDRILEAEGVSPEDVAVLEVSAIPVRFEQLMNGNIQAATLPDPLASAAIAAGAKLIADDSQYPEVVQSVLTFRTDALRRSLVRFGSSWPPEQGSGGAKCKPGQVSQSTHRAGARAGSRARQLPDAALPRSRRADGSGGGQYRRVDARERSPRS